MQEKSAGAILFHGSQVLLLHYEAGHWGFPKGNIESGESEQQAALRELEEETGISQAALIPGFRETIEYFYRLKGKTVHKTVIFFLAKTQQKEVKISHEHIGFKWLPQKEALKQLTFKNSRKNLEKAISFLKNPTAP